MVDVTIQGLPELLRELKRLNEAAQGRVARNMAMGAARLVARHARANAPVGETGDLKRNTQAGGWALMATLQRIERELPNTTEAERAAYAEHLVKFARDILNASMESLRIWIAAAERQAAMDETHQRIEAALAAWNAALGLDALKGGKPEPEPPLAA